MSDDVDVSARHERHDGWPPSRFHPVYDSFTEWLDNEAPAPITNTGKKRNTPRFRPLKGDE